VIYERKHQPPVSRARFAQRLMWHGVGALVLLAVSLDDKPERRATP
jgi:hypothetical protein